MSATVPLPSLRRHLTIAALAMATALAAFASPTHAQETPPSSAFADAPAQVAHALEQSKAQKVAVFDFVNATVPGWNRLGRQLAADFAVRLDGTPHQFTLIKHSDIENWLHRDSFIQDDLAIADVAAYAIRGSGADAFVTATLSASTDKSTIAVMLHVYDVRRDGEPVTILATIPFTPDLNALIEAPTGTQNATPATGKNGFSLPSCVYCPAAEFTAEGVKAHFSGMAVLAATIEPNGRASQIRIVKGVPYGLDAPAISAVRKWRFQPAKDSNGHSVAVLQTIEIMFHSAS